jgi:16S rRNA (guanine1207-N2)-methyltransferase
VTCVVFDLHQAELARAASGGRGADDVGALDGGVPSNLAIECVADLPGGPFDVAAIPLRAGADSELAWELLQTAFDRLAIGGRLWTAVDEPRDRWVAGRMKALFGGRYERHANDEAVAYGATKREPLDKPKRFECEFAFRDRDRLIKVVSRPGVFSHRKLDLGARALIESLSEPDGRGRERELVQPGSRVLDLGCGAGAVGFAAALRAADVAVHAIDSMPRALDCASRGAAANGIAERHSVQLAAGGEVRGGGGFDLVLANPPYYSQHAIAEIFVRFALRALKPSGRVHVVTKQPEWFLERLARDLAQVRARELRGYAVVEARRK